MTTIDDILAGWTRRTEPRCAAHRGSLWIYGRDEAEVDRQIEEHPGAPFARTMVARCIARRGEIELVGDTWHAVAAQVALPIPTFPVIGIIGTNGKTTTTALVAAALRAAGRRVVSATCYGWCFDGQSVPRPDVGCIPAAAFWACTLSTFVGRADIGVVEVKLGSSPRAFPFHLAAITTIFDDHKNIVGGTREGIARAKAEAIALAPRVVAGRLEPELRAVVAEHIRGALIDVDDQDYANAARTSIPFPGRHHVDNAAVAIRVLREIGIASHDFSGARVPGRCEHRDGLIIDLCKNTEGARAFVRYLQDQRVEPMPVYMTLRHGSHVEGMLRALAPIATEFRLAPTGDAFYASQPWNKNDLRRARRLRPAAYVDRITAPGIVVGPYRQIQSEQ